MLDKITLGQFRQLLEYSPAIVLWDHAGSDAEYGHHHQLDLFDALFCDVQEFNWCYRPQGRSHSDPYSFKLSSYEDVFLRPSHEQWKAALVYNILGCLAAAMPQESPSEDAELQYAANTRPPFPLSLHFLFPASLAS